MDATGSKQHQHQYEGGTASAPKRKLSETETSQGNNKRQRVGRLESKGPEFRPLRETMPHEFGADVLVVFSSSLSSRAEVDEAGRRAARPAILQLCSPSDYFPFSLPLRRLITGYSQHDHVVVNYNNSENITKVVSAVVRLSRLHPFLKGHCTNKDDAPYLYLIWILNACFGRIGILPAVSQGLVEEAMEWWRQFKMLPDAMSTLFKVLHSCDRLSRHLGAVFDGVDFTADADRRLYYRRLSEPERWRAIRQGQVWIHDHMSRPTFWGRAKVVYKEHPTVGDQWICAKVDDDDVKKLENY
jgi:hypothetical protein